MATAPDIAEYVSLLKRFSEDEISLQNSILPSGRFKAEKRMFAQPLFDILNKVFTDLEVHAENGVKTFGFELTTDELIRELKQAYLGLPQHLEWEA